MMDDFFLRIYIEICKYNNVTLTFERRLVMSANCERVAKPECCAKEQPKANKCVCDDQPRDFLFPVSLGGVVSDIYSDFKFNLIR